ncbi:hypothetical protein [Agrobacterium tumefaciens]|uniref:hypothetical protein n=1 Tax=Agrobacterium tumefaciens TaxID=358 RepID=UPI00061876CD|nr:hypothetical protein [Agrobacterium tumefaciens]AKC07184.1 hypothetical protein Ach5_14080 [Agrobacterium tumefaciens]AYM67325.1 hypothetical protein AtA6_11080 [Agrobacterium tumefaciens]NIB54918.1 hypothetical protein [Agrobacterium tumefaciens]NSZ21635.1 hypothetical protein [Agrobacterium tumefaciens]QQE32530.1 hypothetical protein I6I05_11285 [Agrobacterium tumefaciens]
MNAYIVLATACVIVILYAYIRVRVANFVQPLRLELVDRAEKLLARHDLLEEDRRGIEHTLDSVFSVFTAWLFALMVFPCAIGSAFRKKKNSELRKGVAYRKELYEFIRIAVPCTLASSPLAFIVFFTAALLATLIALPVKTAIMLSMYQSANVVAEHRISPVRPC